ncbi:hypothetical protein [Bradyrhizobium sp. 172]|uniref:hypothetical protein n=1 Tax=Bradyrhizobium sp. 172 TaxID=2782643 RepID=UPI001FFF0F90|nr:hypothetical protein [Bradyrhizobium sp. 172]UPJ96404.1 hypothetical protein IVB07_02200 [Bradyrhizobium sp. 172]
MKPYLPLTAAAFLFAPSELHADPAVHSILKVAQSTSSVDTTGTPDALQDLKKEIESLKATIVTQTKELAQQRGAIDVVTRRQDGSNTAILAAAGAVLTAVLAGLFALWNQNKQAAQERLLKAIEIIMSSRSGYQAAVRRDNLSVFLDEPTKAHLKTIETNFSGPEFTDLHVGLAQAMAEKASTPEEVLDIWIQVLKEKKVFMKVDYRKKSTT